MELLQGPSQEKKERPLSRLQSASLGTSHSTGCNPLRQKDCRCCPWNCLSHCLGGSGYSREKTDSKALKFYLDKLGGTTAHSQDLEPHLNADAGTVLTLPSQARTLRHAVHPPYKFSSLLPCPHIWKVCLARNYMHLNTVNKWDRTRKHFAAMGFEIWTLIAFNSWCCPITGSSGDVLKVSFLFEKPWGINKEWEFLTSCSSSKLK